MAPAHPKTYKAYAFLEKGGPLKPIVVDWKDPAPGEVVVKVLACGVCASDEMVKGQFFPTQAYPRVPGHEIVGDVVAVADGEKSWKTGDRVGAGWHGGHCNSCRRCRIGDFVTCPVGAACPTGIGRDGGYAEYATLRSESLASIPTDLDPAEIAPQLCAGVTTFNALRHMQSTPPDIVAVQGIGGLGHLAIQFARKMGFRTIALSTGTSKKELALSLGAHDFIAGTASEQAAALQKLGGARLIMCTAPDTQAMSELINGLDYDGELLVVAVAASAIAVPVPPLLTKRVVIRGWPYGTGSDCEDTVHFARAHDVKVMVEKFPLDQAQEAFDHRATARFRAVIVP
ncbi:GroES-like protein [Fomitopsis serialis]|uniref:GroES-like protein n=1 Tax=Fomitopsis serialis TaxID=139415 RepID=UPI002008549A|nr:GroES-like protein [Neoantrodia serialis]KAH9933793.1 GroES-like protein [Neoantrodia serialis]